MREGKTTHTEQTVVYCTCIHVHSQNRTHHKECDVHLLFSFSFLFCSILHTPRMDSKRERPPFVTDFMRENYTSHLYPIHSHLQNILDGKEDFNLAVIRRTVSDHEVFTLIFAACHRGNTPLVSRLLAAYPPSKKPYIMDWAEGMLFALREGNISILKMLWKRKRLQNFLLQLCKKSTSDYTFDDIVRDIGTEDAIKQYFS